MSEPSIWIMGDWRNADFSAAIDWLQGRARCTLFEDPPTAVNGGPSEPLAILLVQSRPGQFSREHVERLHARTPLARIVALVGPWCEGEGRSGQPWPGVARVPWRVWQGRLAGELSLAGSNGSLSPRLPRTITETERIDQLTCPCKPKSDIRAQALICTERKDRFESVADALAQLGWQATWSFTSSYDVSFRVDLLVCDGWEYATGLQHFANAQRLLLLDFPRPEDYLRAADAGIEAVIGLPMLLSDLAMAVDRPQNSRS